MKQSTKDTIQAVLGGLFILIVVFVTGYLNVSKWFAERDFFMNHQEQGK